MYLLFIIILFIYKSLLSFKDYYKYENSLGRLCAVIFSLKLRLLTLTNALKFSSTPLCASLVNKKSKFQHQILAQGLHNVIKLR